MRSFRLLMLIWFGLTWFFSVSAHAQKDMTNAKDHPKIPRLESSVIYGYEYSDYDRGKFIMREDDKYKISSPEGKRTRIFYLAPKSYTVAGVFANYRTALAELGTVESIYFCEQNCPRDVVTNLVWQEENRIKTSLQGSAKLYQVGVGSQEGVPQNFSNQGYAYATVTTDEARYHFSVYTALFTKGGFFRTEPDVTDTRSVHVEIVEEAGFTPTLEVVTPDEIAEGISEQGRIALYGIYFDFDSDQLKPNSNPVLEAIAAALNANPEMQIFVAGHTDNQGAYDYNMDLS
jgi:outer membrane protein OmpA-like peptidoglycan-associated protein